jgi:hypothetical protein
MTRKKQRALLVDLAKLFVRHGPEEFVALANYLRNSTFADDLAMILESAAAAAPRKPTKRRRKTTTGQSEERLARQIESSNYSVEDKALLYDLNRELHSGSTLRTLKQIKEFAEENSLLAISGRSRDRGAEQLVAQLIQLEPARLRRIASMLTTTGGVDQDRSLAQWSDIILGGPREP